MCGIFGYIGKRAGANILIQGLKNLEYRGYDSAGIAFIKRKKIEIIKESGKIDVLESKISPDLKLSAGIAHTRWATHGNATKENAHPHLSFGKHFAIVHNGIIENHAPLRENLKNVDFKSQTDSEIIAHLLEISYEEKIKALLKNLGKNSQEKILPKQEKFTASKISINKLDKLEKLLAPEEISEIVLECLKEVCAKIQGAFALAVICASVPNAIFLAKYKSPLMIGASKNGAFFSSDVNTLSCFCSEFLILSDGEFACIGKNFVDVFNQDLKVVKKNFLPFENKNGLQATSKCFMKDEIAFSAHALTNTAKFFKIQFENIPKEFWHNINEIYLIGCGTAYHSCLACKKILHHAFKKPVFCEVASEFIYGENLITKKSLCVFVSQSGETADTLSALAFAKSLGAKTLGITNNKTSTLSFECAEKIVIHAGWERAVASTKAYVCQIATFYLLAGFLCGKGSEFVENLRNLSKIIENFDYQSWAKNLAEKALGFEKIIFIGRQEDYVSALEGSLKLKEISYINSIAIQSGELKHGTLALVDEKTLVIAIQTKICLKNNYKKNVENNNKFVENVLPNVEKNRNYLSKVRNISENVELNKTNVELNRKCFNKSGEKFVENVLPDVESVLENVGNYNINVENGRKYFAENNKENVEANRNCVGSVRKNVEKVCEDVEKNRSGDFLSEIESKNLNSIKEVLARGGSVVCLSQNANFLNALNLENALNLLLPSLSSELNLNNSSELIFNALNAIIAILPLQTFACEVCLSLGFSPDTPRNLSKSVTVE